MDQSPRYHAMNIAVLSAETVSWETFLRAHLDIMNDRFERSSDGSYAWAGRKTYIKELEELDIDVAKLLFGIVLRIENPSKNHYFGDVGRLGRALSETTDANKIEEIIFEMIGDNQLDDFNRVLMYFLFTHYNYYVSDKDKKNKNYDRLEHVVSEMPEYLANRIKVERIFDGE